MNQCIKTTLKRDINGNSYITGTFGAVLRMRQQCDHSKTTKENHIELAQKIVEKLGFNKWTPTKLIMAALSDKEFIFIVSENNQYV